MSINFKRCALGLLALFAAFVVVGAGLITTANASIKPMVGVHAPNESTCGSNVWEFINVAPRLKAHDSAGTCISAELYHADFAVTRITRQIGWQYPNLSDGWELGETGCPSSADMRAGLCSNLPVQWKSDGAPLATSHDWLAPGTYNDSYDIWLAPSKGHTSYLENGGDVELMVWVDSPGINDSRSIDYYVTIAGVRYGVMTWEAHNSATGQSWRYIAFIAPRHYYGALDTSLWLNEFFRNANSRGLLPSDYWLIAVDKGFEINSGGTGLNVHYYDISGLR
jgi:Glycosyl hydrolase family 12